MKSLIRITFIILFFSDFVSAGIAQDTSRVIELKKKVQELFSGEIDSALIYAQEAFALSEKSGYEKGQAEFLNVIGLIYDKKGDNELALDYYNRGLALAYKYNFEGSKAAILLNVGMMHENRGDHKLALENMLVALRIRERMNDDKGIGRVLNNIAMVFTEQENYTKALEYYQRSVDYKLKAGDTLLAASTYNNMAIALIDLQQYDEAIALLNKALIINTMYEEDVEIAANIGNLGLAFDKMGDKKKAKQYYERSIAMQRKFNLKNDGIAVPINNLGTIYLEENNLDEAEKLLKESLAIATEAESKEDIREALGNLATLYSKGKKFELAYGYQQKFNALTESLASEKSGRAMAEMMVKYETQKKEEQNKFLEQQNVLQTLRLERNNFIITFLVSLLLLLVISGMLFYRQRKLKAEQERIVLEQKLLRSQMNPHFIFNSLQSIQSFMLAHKPEEAAGYLSDFAKLMRMILENSRQEYCTLEDIIQQNIYYMKMQTLRFENKFDSDIYVHADLDTEHLLVPPMLLQPFIENSIEHGFKTKTERGKIDVRVYRQNGSLMLEVEDNGIGRIASEKLKDSVRGHASLAMAITAERIASLNKKSRKKIKLEIIDLVDEFQKPSGTKVIFTLPVKELA